MSRRRPTVTPKSNWSLGGAQPAAPQRVARGAPGGAAALPQRGNTGGKSSDNGKAIVDYLKFSWRPDGGIPEGLETIRRYLKLWADLPLNMVPADMGLRGWGESMDVMTFLDGEWIRAGIVAWGGYRGRGGLMLVDFTGRGCAVITDWQAVFATLQDLDATIKRCDLAMDFIAGEVRIRDIEDMYDAGDFHCGGRIPDYRKIESGRAGARGCKGTTFEIGHRNNGKMLRAYEKGRQKGCEESEWVRLEIEFGCKDRTIPHEIVIKRDEYFVGAYKALEQYVDVAALRCRTDQLEREIDLNRTERAARHQYGKFTHQWLLANDEDVAAFVVAIRVEGVPAKMQKSALAAHVHGAHDPAPDLRE
ncbi:replication initiation factor domain-containing protein [Burkholderia cenocepacia]|uniref:replication initiation factor domain-containing protein n=1 Tax=Burkholderia cenocepacia TaxID=95486 RepID=UPI002AB13E75|nr:replication initiation factor domain-containing protein [Burkholderia cenocepacia]